MNRTLLLTIIFLTIASFLSPAVSELKMIYPNGGEVLISGENTLIKWIYINPETDNSVILILYKDGIKYMTISKTASETDSFLWVIPENIPAGTKYRIRIRSNHNLSLNDFSDNDFTIQNRMAK